MPPGQFQMGSAPDAPELDAASGESPPVTLAFARPFLVSSREITVGEFRRFVEATGAKAVPGCRVWSGGQWIQDPTAAGATRASRRRRATTTRSSA